jgi:hypothetical protein
MEIWTNWSKACEWCIANAKGDVVLFIINRVYHYDHAIGVLFYYKEEE